MTTLHVVMGGSGEYSDRKEWMVAAYANESEAEKHVLALEEAVRAFYALDEEAREALAKTQSDDCATRYTHPLDRPVDADEMGRWSAWSDDYNRYWLETVELLEVVP